MKLEKRGLAESRTTAAPNSPFYADAQTAAQSVNKFGDDLVKNLAEDKQAPTFPQGPSMKPLSKQSTHPPYSVNGVPTTAATAASCSDAFEQPTTSARSDPPAAEALRLHLLKESRRIGSTSASWPPRGPEETRPHAALPHSIVYSTPNDLSTELDEMDLDGEVSDHDTKINNLVQKIKQRRNSMKEVETGNQEKSRATATGTRDGHQVIDTNHSSTSSARPTSAVLPQPSASKQSSKAIASSAAKHAQPSSRTSKTDAGKSVKKNVAGDHITKPAASFSETSASVAEGRRLYIGNLGYATTEAVLKQFFSGYDVKSTSIHVCRRKNSPARYYAFVELKSAKEADKAINELSGNDILERKVSVRLAHMPGEINTTPADEPSDSSSSSSSSEDFSEESSSSSSEDDDGDDADDSDDPEDSSLDSQQDFPSPEDEQSPPSPVSKTRSRPEKRGARSIAPTSSATASSIRDKANRKMSLFRRAATPSSSHVMSTVSIAPRQPENVMEACEALWQNTKLQSRSPGYASNQLFVEREWYWPQAMYYYADRTAMTEDFVNIEWAHRAERMPPRSFPEVAAPRIAQLDLEKDCIALWGEREPEGLSKYFDLSRQWYSSEEALVSDVIREERTRRASGAPPQPFSKSVQQMITVLKSEVSWDQRHGRPEVTEDGWMSEFDKEVEIKQCVMDWRAAAIENETWTIGLETQTITGIRRRVRDGRDSARYMEHKQGLMKWRKLNPLPQKGVSKEEHDAWVRRYKKESIRLEDEYDGLG